MKKLVVVLAVVACSVSAMATITYNMSGLYSTDGGKTLDTTASYYTAFGFNSGTRTDIATLTDLVTYLGNKSTYGDRIDELKTFASKQSPGKNTYSAAKIVTTTTPNYITASNTRMSPQGTAGSGNYFTVIQYSDGGDNWAFRVVDMGSAAEYNTVFQDFGTTKGTWSGWTAVPEPTSGLLMLLGVAGLALKRKRA